MTGFGEIAERLRRSTVQVLDASGTGTGGSGIVFDTNGIVLTNAHVVQGATEVRLWDGARLPATILKHDHRCDLAALRIEASGLPAASLAHSGAPRAGELAIAAGNPLGFIGAVSTGVIHNHGPLPGLSPRPWVQTTVRLAPGSSGGPLANARGEVIGVNTMIVRTGAGGDLALAIPITAAVRFLDESNKSGFTLGVVVRPVSASGERAPAFLILETTPDEPAGRASLLPGDLLIGANGRRFTELSDLQDVIDNAPGGRLSLQFRRGPGLQDRTVAIQLERRRTAA